VILAEVKSNTYLDVQQITRDVIKKIGYTKVHICLKQIHVVFYPVHEQSADINQGVDRANPEDRRWRPRNDVWLRQCD
jgi:S-adenosylmethionine synthetase